MFDSPLVIIGLCMALLFAAVQSVLCVKASSLSVKLIPVYVIIGGGLAALLCVSGIFNLDAEFVSGDNLAGAIIVIVFGIAAVGDALAWIACLGFKRLHGKRKKN